MIDDQAPRWLLGGVRGSPAFPGRDVAGRDLGCANAAGTDGSSLLISACSNRVWWLSQGSPQRRAAAIRALRVNRRGVRAVAQTSASGTLTLRVTRNGRPLPREASAQAMAGHASLERPGRLETGWHRVKLTLDHGWGDSIDIWGGGRITPRQARRLIEARLEQPGEGTVISIQRRCRPFGPRRVDCEVRFFEDFIDNEMGYRDTCLRVSSLVLASSGVLHERGYRCGNKQRARFRAHPKWKPSLEAALTAD